MKLGCYQYQHCTQRSYSFSIPPFDDQISSSFYLHMTRLSLSQPPAGGWPAAILAPPPAQPLDPPAGWLRGHVPRRAGPLLMRPLQCKPRKLELWACIFTARTRSCQLHCVLLCARTSVSTEVSQRRPPHLPMTSLISSFGCATMAMSSLLCPGVTAHSHQRQFSCDLRVPDDSLLLELVPPTEGTTPGRSIFSMPQQLLDHRIDMWGGSAGVRREPASHCHPGPASRFSCVRGRVAGDGDAVLSTQGFYLVAQLLLLQGPQVRRRRRLRGCGGRPAVRHGWNPSGEL